MKYLYRPLQNVFMASALTLAIAPVALAGDDHKHDGKGHGHAPEAAEKAPHAHGKEGEHGHEHGDDASHHTVEAHHGGVVRITDGLHHELVMTEEGKVVLYAEGLPEGEGLKAVLVRLIILKGKEKQSLEMILSEGDSNRFETPINTPLKAGDKVVALINIGAEKMRMVRFEITEK